jgi:hypothetical protein
MADQPFYVRTGSRHRRAAEARGGGLDAALGPCHVVVSAAVSREVMGLGTADPARHGTTSSAGGLIDRLLAGNLPANLDVGLYLDDAVVSSGCGGWRRATMKGSAKSEVKHFATYRG